MTAGLGFFGAKGGTEAVDLAEGHTSGLQVKLSRLGQVGLLAEVVGLEQSGSTLASGRGEHGRIDEHKAPVVEEVATSLTDFMADPQQRVRPGGAQPKMAVVQEEFRAVLLGRDGVVLRGVNHGHVLESHLVAAGRTGLLPHGARHFQGGLLAEGAAGGEDLRRDFFGERYALEVSGAIPHHQEANLSRLPPGVEPTPDQDLLPLEPCQVPDRRGPLHRVKPLPRSRSCGVCARR